jgi:hypothetical protein
MTDAATRSRAAAMIARKGQAVTITVATPGSYDPATGSAAPSTTNVETFGAVLPLNPFRKNGTSIVEGDQQLLLSATKRDGTVMDRPPVNSIVTLANGDTATITAIDPLEPSGVALIFDAVIRRAA